MRVLEGPVGADWVARFFRRKSDLEKPLDENLVQERRQALLCQRCRSPRGIKVDEDGELEQIAGDCLHCSFDTWSW